jgi:hypothetical protein
MDRPISLPLALICLLVGGCHQNVNQGIPLSPISPLGASTRVPPPATGSYAVPGSYYQGQASLGGFRSADQLASGPQTSVVSGSPSRELASDANELPAASLPLWTENSPRYAGTVQPASYTEPQVATGSGLRPALRGMQVVDLTSGRPQPQSAMNSAQEAGLAPAGSASAFEAISAAPGSFPSSASSRPSTSPASTTPNASLQWRRPEL